MKLYKLYCLRCPVSNEIRYIGQTSKSLKERLRTHVKGITKNNNHRTSWLKSLVYINQLPVIEQLFVTNDQDYIDRIEVGTIKQLRKRKYKLVNSDRGGRTRRGYKHKEETKLLLSKIAKNQCKKAQIEAMKKANTGLKRSDKEKKQISNRMKGRIMTIEVKQKLSQSLKDKNVQPSRETIMKGVKSSALLRTKTIIQLDIQGNIIAMYNGHLELMQSLGLKGKVNKNVINAVKNNKVYKGFMWKYKD